MADKSLDILIKLGVIGQEDAKAVRDLMAETKDATKSTGDATAELNETVSKGTEKWGESRREIRQVGNELGRVAGVSGLGGLALGGVAAAAFAAAKSLEFLKGTWETIQETIKGPIEVGLPAEAPAHISAAATAWNQYAEARSKVIEKSEGPEATASSAEKKLNTELELIKKVLAAEKEKALAELEFNKDAMSPDAYKAARANISEIFGEAETNAEEKHRRTLISNKDNEAFNLEMDARRKTQQALAIKSAPKEVAENNQKTLDENAAAAEKAKKEIEERLALISRVQKSKAGDDVPEYEGLTGKLLKFAEANQSWSRYGPITFDDARGIEEQRLAQANAAIKTADTYRRNESESATQKKRLMEDAGDESGKATVLRREIKTDSQAERSANTVDKYVADLHHAATSKVTGSSAQTAAAVQQFTAATVAGFNDVHGVFIKQQAELNEVRRRLTDLEFQKHTAP